MIFDIIYVTLNKIKQSEYLPLKRLNFIGCDHTVPLYADSYGCEDKHLFLDWIAFRMKHLTNNVSNYFHPHRCDKIGSLPKFPGNVTGFTVSTNPDKCNFKNLPWMLCFDLFHVRQYVSIAYIYSNHMKNIKVSQGASYPDYDFSSSTQVVKGWVSVRRPR